MSRIFRRGTTQDNHNNLPSLTTTNNNNQNNHNNNPASSSTTSLNRKRAPSNVSTKSVQSKTVPPSPDERKGNPFIFTKSTARYPPSLASPSSGLTARERFGDSQSALDVRLDGAGDEHADGDRIGSYDSPSPRSGSIQIHDEHGDDLIGDVSPRKIDKQRLSPLERRLGETNPYILPHQSKQDATSTQYPGVILGSFAGVTDGADFGGMSIDGSMDDILDPNATTSATRQGSTSGQAGANIAPWLSDDTPSGTPMEMSEDDQSTGGPSRNGSYHGLDRSTPSMPQLRRKGTSDGTADGHGRGVLSRNGSQQLFKQAGNQEGHHQFAPTRSRLGSSESVQTLSGAQSGPARERRDEVQPLPLTSITGGGRHTRHLPRHGSTATSMSTGSTGSEKKKGFLPGFLKRKTGQSVSHNSHANDFAPSDNTYRGSASGSNSSRLSTSTSFSSFSNTRSPPTELFSPGGKPFPRPGQGSVPEDCISPLHEIGEPDFRLDTNLDDMEGIVDTTMNSHSSVASTHRGLPVASTAPGVPVSQPPASTASISTQVTDAHNQTSSFETNQSGSVSSTGSGDPAPQLGRLVVAQAERQSGDPFVRTNPFQASPQSSIDGKSDPPSPHTLTVSPKYALQPSTQPRRPSQLRNVKMGSMTSSVSSDVTDSGILQPLAPAWASTMSATGLTLFNDPFTGNAAAGPSTSTTQNPAAIPPQNEQNLSVAPPIASGVGAAWAAPESWGVEADEEEVDTSSSEEDDWAQGEDTASPAPTIQPSPTDPSRKPPPFGFKSFQGTQSSSGNNQAHPGGRKSRVKTSSGRPSSSHRPNTSGRPGTSGSMHSSTLPHYIRIYRGDGSYTVMSFPITTTTAEIINVLSGQADAAAGKKITTNMRLYLRLGGHDRQLQPSEKPLAIQDRRLRQAGYTDAEHIEELGKDDLFILCKFLYQTPNLPVMNPEEESSYDSFEFIDVAGRDLLTIPIFLHLHAHNIIILNVSRNPMTDIPLDFIQACTSLKELRMSYMALKRIPASICASTTLSRLDVSCNRIADLESVPLHEIQTLTSLKVQNNKLTSIPSYFAQMKSLKYLNISNNKFEHFPPVVSEMSNLVDLDVSFNTIGSMPSEMSNLKSLERLAAFGNELVTFPASFSTLANLRALDVRRNKLTDLTSVYALPNLTILQADNNELVTLDAQIGPKVRQFSVPHNSITRFTLAPQISSMAVNYALTRLDLSHGKLSSLADEAFTGLVNLTDLNLSFNQFTRLPSTLDRLVNLEQLLCTDNMLEGLPEGIGRLQKLRVLNIHNNNLKEFPSALWACSSLSIVNASSNLLKTVPNPPPMSQVIEFCGPEVSAALGLTPDSTEYPATKSITELHFADNRFTDDIFHYLSYSASCQIVNLSFNDIYEVPSGTLRGWVDLEQLYLSGNKLTSLPAEDLEKLQKLRVLHVNGNKLQTLPSELGALTSLQHLDVGSNVLKYNIANWPYDWNWNWNTELRYLNLSGNKRLEIKPTSAQDMTHASSFRKDLSDFTALSRLRILGLMDVTLRIPSLPDENDEKRVRTSFSDINNMAYGISDMLGSAEHLAMFDLVVPNFRGKDNECLFGMFGRAQITSPGKIPKYVQESFGQILSGQLDKLGKDEAVTEALRRTFLTANRSTFQHLMGSTAMGRKSSVTSVTSIDPLFRNWSPSPMSPFRQGSSGAVVYLVDKILHVGNVGDCLVVISRKGEAELLSKHHNPTDREETARIRMAEAWVSTKGYVNDEKDVDISRAIGYFQHFPAVNSDPEIKTRQLSESDEFVIIGNHALWKCCSYQTAVDIARTERDDPMMAAQKLRDFAISYGAEGSVMVMVVNISDLFYTKGQRRRGLGSAALAGQDGADGGSSRDKRNIRRQYEEVGDRTLNRLQQEIEPPTGQVAIVFTDIVNSTHLWETNPGMPTAIKMHHNLMRRQLRLDGGYEVKTEGDSFMVSFQTVTAALVWAFNCQIGLLQQEWPRELLEAPDGKIVYDSEGNIVQRGLRVRMGVHWGAPSCEKDPITRRMDYYGPMVNRSARINASADGGQLMASQDVINEIQALREYLETLDEAGLSDMPPEMKREVAELKRIGFEVKEMGERKLKGLEVPEKLHLLYPKCLAGRFETSNELRANVEVNDTRPAIQGPRHIDIEEVRELVKLVLRLEALCNVSQSLSPPLPPQASPAPQGPPSPSLISQLTPNPGPHSAGMEITSSRRTHAHSHSSGQIATLHRGVKIPPPTYLGPSVKDDMGDEELLIIMDSLVTRLENVTSTLYIKNLGGFSSVLAALEQATRIDSKLIVHALSLMSGALGR